MSFTKINQDANSGPVNPEYSRKRVEVHEVSSEGVPLDYSRTETLPGGGLAPSANTLPNSKRERTEESAPQQDTAKEWWRPGWASKNWLKTCWSSEFILQNDEKSSSKSEPRYNINPSAGFEKRLQLSDHSSYTYSEFSSKPKPRVPIYTMQHRLEDAIRASFASYKLQGDHVATLVVEFHAIYDWVVDCNAKYIEVARGHENTIARNSNCEFGVVLGSKLDPSVDHVISLRVDDGVEFGIGVCTKENARSEAKRDFMCERGGWGYYNYKSKFVGMKPKYPSGWYNQKHSCMKHYPEDKVLMGGDVLTMTVTREGLDSSYDYSKPALGNGCFTIGFFKNDEDMGCVLKKIQGDLNLCLNYYFMATTIRLLSDHKAPLKQIAAKVAA